MGTPRAPLLLLWRVLVLLLLLLLPLMMLLRELLLLLLQLLARSLYKLLVLRPILHHTQQARCSTAPHTKENISFQRFSCMRLVHALAV
jgi:hypothetical protein